MKEKIHAFLVRYFDPERIITDELTITLQDGGDIQVEAWAVTDVQGNVRPLWEVTAHAHSWISSLVTPQPGLASTLSADLVQLCDGAIPVVKSGNYLALLPVVLSAKKTFSDKGVMKFKVSSKRAGSSVTMVKNCVTQDILTDPSFIGQVLPAVESIKNAISENKQKVKLQEKNWI